MVCCRLICQRGQTHTELFYVDAAGRRNGLCERRGTHILALKHAAPRLRGLRLGLQTRAGHGPDGAHANRCAYPAVEKFCRASSAGPPTDFRTLCGLKWSKSVENRHRLPISEALHCSAARHTEVHACAELSSDGAHVSESNSRSNVFRFRLASVCVPSR